MRISRRNFIRTATLSALALAAWPFGSRPDLAGAAETATGLGGSPAGVNGYPDLVGIRNGTPRAMFEAAMKSLGGMDRFVKKGNIVVVKPNIGWNKTPAEGANTNPELVHSVVSAAIAAGAKKVYVFDNTCNEWKACYANSGIERAASDAGATVVPANADTSYKTVKLKGTKTITEAQVHELWHDADVVINVPVLKHHGSGRMTASLKNLMGVVYDRRFWHRNGLHECIAEFPTFRKPDLNIVDCYTVMMANGPRGINPEDLALKKMLVAGTDLVGVDTAAAKILEVDPAEVPYLGMAQRLGLGTMALDTLKIERVTL